MQKNLRAVDNLPLQVKKIVPMFNVNIFMLNFEHF